MKTPKLMTAIIAILLLSNLLFAGNPKSTADKMIEKLNTDVTLTNDQKNDIKKNIKAFNTKLHTANSMADKEEKYLLRKKAFDEYKSKLDSILTLEQKAQLETQIKGRKESNSNDTIK
jgi:cell division protein FtsX